MVKLEMTSLSNLIAEDVYRMVVVLAKECLKLAEKSDNSFENNIQIARAQGLLNILYYNTGTELSDEYTTLRRKCKELWQNDLDYENYPSDRLDNEFK